MLDKLNMTIDDPSPNLDYIKQISDSIRPGLDKQYRHCLVFERKGEHFMTIKTAPKLPRVSSLSIELNPSKFDDFYNLEKILNEVTDSKELVIRRIDHAVDLDISVQLLWEGLSVNGKQKRSDFGPPHDSIHAFTIGKFPEQITVYDKRFEQICSKRRKKIDSPFSDQIHTRLEVRQTKSKLPVTKFLQLPSLIHYDPFTKIDFLQPRPGDSFRDSMNSAFFEIMASEIGMQGLRKRLDNKRSFKRTFLPKLDSFNLADQLRNLYQQDLAKFFAGYLNSGDYDC